MHRFYTELWNSRDDSRVAEILSPQVRFRGSLGTEVIGTEGLLAYMDEVCAALSDYRCTEINCIAEGCQVFTRMRFSGRHQDWFRGFGATGRTVSWEGAALFRCEDGLIADIWVLADLTALDALLLAQQVNS